VNVEDLVKDQVVLIPGSEPALYAVVETTNIHDGVCEVDGRIQGWDPRTSTGFILPVGTAVTLA
jgi:hypothetical protein